MAKNFDEFDLLELYYKRMEKLGQKHNITRVTVDDRMVEDIYSELDKEVTIDELQSLANKCIANEWLNRNTLGNPFANLSLSQKGLGVVRSKQIEQKINKTQFQKLSTFAKNHKALTSLILGISGFVLLIFKNLPLGE